MSEENLKLILNKAISLPLVKVNREEFLRKNLLKHFLAEEVHDIINYSYEYRDSDRDILDKISKECINFETNKVSAISAISGIPGGFGMIGTIPADLVQFYGHVLIIIQKLMYLYGWPDLGLENSNMDDETINKMLLFLGIMFGVAKASTGLKILAQNLGTHTAKRLSRMALTKTAYYPIVKQVSKSLGIQMTKQIFAKNVGKVIPIVGAVSSGGLTYIFFKNMSKRLKSHLSSNIKTYSFHGTSDFSDFDIVSEQ